LHQVATMSPKTMTPLDLFRGDSIIMRSVSQSHDFRKPFDASHLGARDGEIPSSSA
jgi:hypothetical protein